MSDSEFSKGYINNRVGPVIRTGEVAQAVIEAAEEDNPGREISVRDELAYVRIDTDGEMILRRETIQRALGRHFDMQEIEINMACFAGRIENTSDYIRFYFDKKL